MQEIEVNKTKALTVPAGVNAIQIVHEWGDIVASATGLTPAATYNFLPDSIGAHHIIWKNVATQVSSVYYNVFAPLLTSSDFFNDNPELEDLDSKFTKMERRVRYIVEMYTGQKFGPYINKTLKVAGDDGESLELPVRIRKLSSLTDTYSTDFTDYAEVAPGSEFFLQRKHTFRYYSNIKSDVGTERTQNFFTHSLDFNVAGDFGWPYVPPDVSEAASILMVDELTDANELRKHGFLEAQLGDFQYKLNADLWGTTGNSQADLILSPYVVINLGLI